MRKPRPNPYDRFKDRPLNLNDYLAIDRTVLANERTLLAYGRTALAEVIIGGSALKFFDSPVLTVVGWLFLLGGMLTMLVGWRRFRHTNRLLRFALESQTGESEHPLEEKLTQAAEEAQAAKSTTGRAEPPARR